MQTTSLSEIESCFHQLPGKLLVSSFSFEIFFDLGEIGSGNWISILDVPADLSTFDYKGIIPGFGASYIPL